MRFAVFVVVWLLACRSLAEEPAPATDPKTPAPPTRQAVPEPGGRSGPGALPEPGTRINASEPPRVGSCLGGNCALGQPATRSEQPATDASQRAERSVRRPGRFAYAGAILGTVSAGLLLAGSIAIAVADHPASERVTRGIWFSELALATPLVALSAFTARRGSSFHGYRGLRNLGWVAYGAAVTDGILLWYAAFQDTPMPPALTIAAGAIASFALLPHALDALVCARKARSRSSVAWTVTPRGVGVSF